MNAESEILRADNQTKQPQKNMNTLEIKGNWNVVKGKIKQRWGSLTDDDLQYTEGQEQELVGRIQKATGETHEAVEKALYDVCKSCTAQTR